MQSSLFNISVNQVPSAFKSYGATPDLMCDANGAWHWLELGSINYDKSTFRYRVFRLASPYSTVEWLELPTALYHACFGVSHPAPTLWVFGFDVNGGRWFADVPGFIFGQAQAMTLELEDKPLDFPTLLGAKRIDHRGFTSDLGSLGPALTRGKIPQLIGRLQIRLSRAI